MVKKVEGRGPAPLERKSRSVECFSRFFESSPEARLPGSADSSHDWLDMYVAWAHLKSPMTPPFFNEAAGLWLTSVAVARRLVLRMAHANIFPNLYVAWIAPTTLYAKTTSMDLARAVANDVFPHLLAAQDSTPEALLHDMAGMEPKGLRDLPKSEQKLWKEGCMFAGQKGWVLDEFSGLLATAGRGYGAGLVEALVRFCDCDPLYRRSTRGSGWVVVRNSYLSLLGASTPAALGNHLASETLWSRGWWPRFALLFPEGRPPWHVSAKVPRPPELVEGLVALYEALPLTTRGETFEALPVQLGAGVYDAWVVYDRAMRYDLQTEDIGRLGACYARLPTKALKIATLLAGLDWARQTKREEAPTIKLPHWYRAHRIAEAWRASAHRLLASVLRSEMDAIEQRVLHKVREAGSEGITLRDIKRCMQDKNRSDVERVVEMLTRMGKLVPFPHKPARGRPTERYRIP